MQRSEIETRYKWNTNDVFENDEAWEKALATLENKIDFEKFRGTLNTAENIFAYYEAEGKLEIELLRVYLYAHLHHDEDVGNTKYNSYLAKVINLFTKLGAATAFATPEISALSEKEIVALSKNPILKDYDYMLARLAAEKKYILSEKEEKILAQTAEPMSAAYDAFEMLDNAELDLPEIEFDGKKTKLTHGLYSLILSGADCKK
ncbi:MAG: hypothetical protein K2K12_00085, partial [Clostridia bacterium]|nr:hypothetical protein [Clostridia bacterium]